MKSFKIKEINKKIKKKEIDQIISIISSENNTSIISSLSFDKKYLFLKNTILSKKINLFVLKHSEKIIGYAIISKKFKYMQQEFNSLILTFLLDLIVNLKFNTILNAALSLLKIDKFFVPKYKKKIFYETTNLNMLAIHTNYQSIGLGYKFLNAIIKKIKKNSKTITCETDNKRSKSFYTKKLKFKQFGILIRFPKFMSILIKKI